MHYRFFSLLLGATIAVVIVSLAAGKPAAPPMKIPLGQNDATLATAGTYTLDPNHVAVAAWVSHMGFSMSAFRFGTVQGTLAWDPKAIAKSKLKATVQTGSIMTNVAGFAEDLQGPKYLKSAQYPEATFVSTGFRQQDATHGKVDGNMTLVGNTFPVTFDVTLVGAGPGFAGGPWMGHVIGIHAEASIDPQVIGLPPMLSAPIAITIDTEFDHRS